MLTELNSQFQYFPQSLKYQWLISYDADFLFINGIT